MYLASPALTFRCAAATKATTVADMNDKLVITIPVIPGVNDQEGIILEVFKYLNSINIKKIRMLPYHSYGREKYIALGMKYKMYQEKDLDNSDLIKFKKLANSEGMLIQED